MITDILRSPFEEALIYAIEANQWAFFKELARFLNAQIYESPNVMWIATDLQDPLFNVVLRPKLTSPDVDAEIEDLLEIFRSRELPMTWWLGPASRPENLVQFLCAHGLKLTEKVIGMATRLEYSEVEIPSGLSIKQVEHEAMMRDWIHPFSVGFGHNELVADIFLQFYLQAGFDTPFPWCHYVGYLQGTPVASLSLFCADGVTGLYNIGTLPSARGQGIGTAITRRAMIAAKTLGYERAILQASPDGLGMYEWLGFKAYYEGYSLIGERV